MSVTAPSASQVKRFLPFILAGALALSFVSVPRPAAIGPVATALQSAPPADRARVASIYRALADVMARDAGRLIATTAQWRAVYQDALRLAAGGTDLVGKYPDLDEAIEETLAKYYSLDVTAIDAKMAEKIAAACKDVERQCE